MTDVITVDLLDRESAVRDALDDSQGTTRAQLFRRAIVGGGAFVAGGVAIGGLPTLALGAPSASQDVEILNFALLLEFLEAEFYREAVDRNTIGGETLAFAKVVRDHEIAHVEFLQQALGSSARSKPEFDFGDTTSDPDKFRATAVVLEDTGVAAYNGQGPRLTKKTLASAAQIVSVEARHAAWIRKIVGEPAYGGDPANYPAPRVLEPALTKAQVEDRVEQTGFVKG